MLVCVPGREIGKIRRVRRTCPSGLSFCFFSFGSFSFFGALGALRFSPVGRKKLNKGSLQAQKVEERERVTRMERFERHSLSQCQKDRQRRLK